MFEQRSDRGYIARLEGLIREWVEFVQEDLDGSHDVESFQVDP
jgi:hypothetical protein